MRRVNGGSGPGDVRVLEYGDGGAGDACGGRLPLVSFLWSLGAPWAVAGILFVLGEGMIDIDDRLPRWGVFTVFGLVGIGIPFAGLVLGAVALTRAGTKGQKWLAATAILLGGAWCVAAAVLLWLAEKA
jgi:hypothetical protein